MQIAAFALFATATLNMGCWEDRVVEVVLRGEATVIVPQDETDVSPSLPRVIGAPDIIGDILADNGYTIEDVDSVTVSGGFYGTANLQGDHDWTLTGEIEAQRVDGVVAGPTVTVFPYTAQSVQAALDGRIVIPFDAAGVEAINGAMADYLAGGSPMIEFRADNSSISPQPNLLDPMVFDWSVRITFNVFIRLKTEVPDPF
jgi:hypothetical protein